MSKRVVPLSLIPSRRLEDEFGSKPMNRDGGLGRYVSGNTGHSVGPPALGQRPQIDISDWPLRSSAIHWPDEYTPPDADLVRTQ
jgi:hypothetical protein